MGHPRAKAPATRDPALVPPTASIGYAQLAHGPDDPDLRHGPGPAAAQHQAHAAVGQDPADPGDVPGRALAHVVVTTEIPFRHPSTGAGRHLDVRGMHQDQLDWQGHPPTVLRQHLFDGSGNRLPVPVSHENHHVGLAEAAPGPVVIVGVGQVQHEVVLVLEGVEPRGDGRALRDVRGRNDGERGFGDGQLGGQRLLEPATAAALVEGHGRDRGHRSGRAFAGRCHAQAFDDLAGDGPQEHRRPGQQLLEGLHRETQE